MNFQNRLILQFSRHYAVFALRMMVSFLFGVFVDPEKFGDFIQVSFSATFFWFLFDAGLKEYALQKPYQINLNQQKTVHLIIGAIISLFLLMLSLTNFLNDWTQKIWLVSFAFSAFVSASAIPSYIQAYWDGNIRVLARLDLAVHGILQPFAGILLWLGEVTTAFICAFIAPTFAHALFIQFRFTIKPEKPQWKLLFTHSTVYLFIHNGIHQIKQKADTLLLSVFVPASVVGLYNRGFSLPHQANQFIQSVIQPVVIPNWAKESKSSSSKILLFIGLSGCLLVISPFVLSWIFKTFWKETWLDLISFLPLFCLWAWLSLMLGLNETRLKANGLNHLVLIRNLFLTVAGLMSILFLHVDFRSMLVALVGFHAIYLLGESFFKMRQQFELGFVLPISELSIIVLYVYLYGLRAFYG